MPGWFRKRRRKRVSGSPAEWAPILERLPIYGRLPEPDRVELRRHVLVLLDEKRFEGCGGLEITDRIRVTVAAYAAVLLLHRETDYFPQLESILVYPDAYEAPTERHLGDYLVEEGLELRSGESWYRGAMVLSWRDVERGAEEFRHGENVVFHEFAHQLDDESGSADGTPVLESRAQFDRWVEVFTREYEALIEAEERGRPTLIDTYGAENPSEFFAVVTECFFGRPKELEARHPDLYHALSGYYRQDPSTW